MEEKTINKTVRMNEIRKEIAWISSEYTRMFPTDPEDLDMVADNDRFHCDVLSNQLIHLKEEMLAGEYNLTLIDKLIIAKLEVRLIRAGGSRLQVVNDAEDQCFKESFGHDEDLEVD